MKVIASNEVFEFLKAYLAKRENKVVRIKLADACCGMVEIEVIYDTQKEDDVYYEVNGVRFVINRGHDLLVKTVRLEKTLYGVDIIRDYL